MGGDEESHGLDLELVVRILEDYMMERMEWKRKTFLLTMEIAGSSIHREPELGLEVGPGVGCGSYAGGQLTLATRLEQRAVDDHMGLGL